MSFQQQRRIEQEQEGRQRLERQVSQQTDLERHIKDLKIQAEKTAILERQVDNLNKQLQAEADHHVRAKKILQEHQKVSCLFVHVFVCMFIYVPCVLNECLNLEWWGSVYVC